MASRRRSALYDPLPRDAREAILDAFRVDRTDEEAAIALDRVPLPGHFRAHAAILLLRRDPYPRIAQLPTSIGGAKSLERIETAATYELHWNRDLVRTPPSIFRLRTQPDATVAILLAVSTGPAWRQGFRKTFNWLYPTVFPPFLRQPDLRSLFENMQRSLREHLQIRLTRVSSLRRLLQTQSRRRYESELTWTDLDAAEAFAEAAEALVYFRSVSFEVCEVQRTGRLVSRDVAGKVSRDAHFTASADFRWLFKAAVQPALETIRRKRTLVQGRGRLTHRGPAPRAIMARFDSAPLQRQDVPRIAERLRRMPTASVSVLHGNPYLHATIVDMNDGSTFDLLVASSHHLMIVPQLRATEAAVTRICRYVYDQVGEAEFVDATSELTAIR